jgi:hypothetical protein
MSNPTIDALRLAVEQLGDSRAEAFGRAMIRKACDPVTPLTDVPLWHVLGAFVLDIAHEQRARLEALRIDLELDGEPMGALLADVTPEVYDDPQR